MRIAIVGNRDYPYPEHIRAFVGILPHDAIIVSGGARGVDTFAAVFGRDRGLQVVEHLPKVKHNATREEFRDAAFARNKVIVQDSDVIFAFICRDKGGTMNTIEHAKMLSKPFFIRDSRI